MRVVDAEGERQSMRVHVSSDLLSDFPYAWNDIYVESCRFLVSILSL